jgi:hypothetical protein
MPPSSRVIDTGLTGPVNKEVLDSVMGQLSDGKWENTPSMAKYWRNAHIEMQGDKVVVSVKDGYDSGFSGKDDVWIRNFFAGKIKEIVYDEMNGKQWDRQDNTVLDYMGGHGENGNKVTVSNAYQAYEILKGRKLKNKYAPPVDPAAKPAPVTPAQAVNQLLDEPDSPAPHSYD